MEKNAKIYKGTSIIAEAVLKGETVKNAIFTAKSIPTGKDYTFKMHKSTWKDRTYLHIYVETQYLDFKYMGYYRSGDVMLKGKKIDTPAAQAIAWIFRNLEKGKYDRVSSQVEFYHIGKCVRCGRTLTDSDSIELGLGPTCRNY